MATPDILATQAAVHAVATGTKIHTSKTIVMAAANFPTPYIYSSQAYITAITDRVEPSMKVSQAMVLGVARGRVYNPKLRAWTFDLDGHEFYVLRLGDGKNLVYDVTTEQWSWWSSGELDTWRVNIGTNWTSSGTIPFEHGSNVVVGDDTFGILWMLNPEQGFDDSTIQEERDAASIKTFPRVATGQTLTRGRITVPCYQVYLVSDTGEPAYDGASVTLSYSDDGGKTFVSAGTIPVTTGNYFQEFAWRSLGLVRSPGRLFRISDDGAFAQIDELTFYDNSAS